MPGDDDVGTVAGSSLIFDPFDAGHTHHMWDLARRLRREHPVSKIGDGFFFVSRYHDVRRVARDNKVFANAGGFRPTGIPVPIEDRTIGELDPPEHGPLRKLAYGAASGPGVVEGLRAFTRGQCDNLLVGILEQGGGDLIAEFSLALTNRVIAKMLGVPLAQCDDLAQQGEEILMSTLNLTNETERGVGFEGAFPEFTAFVDNLVSERLESEHPPDDAITRIATTANDRDELPRTIIRMIMIQLLLGGTATTRDFIGSLYHELIVHPELHVAIGNEPALIPAAVEEALRLAPPVLFVIRTAAVDTEVGGVSINAGDRIIAGLASANRDEDVYDDPDEFRIDRVDPAPHVSFGYGPHLCVGAALARMEGQEALASFVAGVKPGGLTLAPEFELAYMPSPFLFGPLRLDVAVAGGPLDHG
jgi:cytochrome P450